MKLLLMSFLLIMLLSSCKDQQIVNSPPATYYLKQNYPNPFTDTTRIEYGVPSVGPGGTAPWLRMVVYDRFNVKQATLMENGAHPAGGDVTPFTVTWNGHGVNGIKVPSGLYFIELQQLNAATQRDENNLVVLLRITALKQ
jgi:hypothetical protein